MATVLAAKAYMRRAKMQEEEREGGIEYRVSIEEEEVENHPKLDPGQAPPPPLGVFLALLPSVPIEDVRTEKEDEVMNQEPIDHNDMIAVSSLISLAMGQDQSLDAQQCAKTLVDESRERREIKKDGSPPTTDAIASSDHDKQSLRPLERQEKRAGLTPKRGRPKNVLLRYAVKEAPSTYANQYLRSLERPEKRGRPKKDRFTEEEVQMVSDPIIRKLVSNREAAYRHREKKKEGFKELQKEEKQLRIEKERLTEQIMKMNSGVLIWKRNCRKRFGFIPQSTFQVMSAFVNPSPSQSTTSATTASTVGLAARNASLRSEALRLHTEIMNLRKAMGLDGVRTTADQDLPIPLDPNQIILRETKMRPFSFPTIIPNPPKLGQQIKMTPFPVPNIIPNYLKRGPNGKIPRVPIPLPTI